MSVFSHIIKYNYTTQRRLALVLILLALSLIACYIYLVNSTIFKAVSRQNDLERLSVLESKVVTLEQQYLALSSDITLEKAYSLGFIDNEGQTLVFGANSDTRLARSE